MFLSLSYSCLFLLLCFNFYLSLLHVISLYLSLNYLHYSLSLLRLCLNRSVAYKLPSNHETLARVKYLNSFWDTHCSLTICSPVSFTYPPSIYVLTPLCVLTYRCGSFILKQVSFENGPNPASFCLFSFFSQDKYSTNLTINEKSVDGVLGIRAQGGRKVGADESTEL